MYTLVKHLHIDDTMSYVLSFKNLYLPSIKAHSTISLPNEFSTITKYGYVLLPIISLQSSIWRLFTSICPLHHFQGRDNRCQQESSTVQPFPSSFPEFSSPTFLKPSQESLCFFLNMDMSASIDE